MYSNRSASRRWTFRPQRSRNKRKLTKLNSVFIVVQTTNRINKLLHLNPLRRLNFCFHSKISKPKCPKTQRGFSPTTIWLLNVNFTFIYKVWTQTKSWKRPWLLDKFILCCFTLHSATNTPEIHKCYWISEGVNRRRLGSNSWAGGWIWTLQSVHVSAAADSSGINQHVWWRMKRLKDGFCLIFTAVKQTSKVFMDEGPVIISKELVESSQ